MALTNLSDLTDKAEIFHHRKMNVREVQVCQVSTSQSDLQIESSQVNDVVQTQSSVPSDKNQKKKKGNCFNCFKPGHHAYECRSPPRPRPQGKAPESDLMSSLKQMILQYESSVAAESSNTQSS